MDVEKREVTTGKPTPPDAGCRVVCTCKPIDYSFDGGNRRVGIHGIEPPVPGGSAVALGAGSSPSNLGTLVPPGSGSRPAISAPPSGSALQAGGPFNGPLPSLDAIGALAGPFGGKVSWQ